MAKSSRLGSTSNRVEVAVAPESVGVRDSKGRRGAVDGLRLDAT
ncbi:DUF397 domain-containing protein [Saccharopolyspora shandongensis]